MAMLRSGAILAILALTPVGALGADNATAWAYPRKPEADTAPDTTSWITVPGSKVRLHSADIDNIAGVADWFPADHPPMPPVVGARSSPTQWACGYCHQADGGGRPENAALAGLPAPYIITQVAAFRSGARNTAHPGWSPTDFMISVAKETPPDEVAKAADYFAKLPFRPRVKIVEGATAPHHAASGFVYVQTQGAPQAIHDEIVEMPTDAGQFEKRDPHVAIVAYVPTGSIARGRALATTEHDQMTCETCHGEGLTGDKSGPAPPLAGRSPTYLFRQLHAFETGARASGDMQPIAARLSEADMVALAAYTATLKP